MADRNWEEIEKAEEEWAQGPIKEFLSRVPERRKEFTTPSGIPVKRLYTPSDVRGLDYMADLGFPGRYPYTRGPYPTMYRGQLWTFRPETGRDTPEATNAQFKKIMEAGATGLSLGFNFDFITSDEDPDEPVFQERHGTHLGRSGLCYCTLRDWELAFEGIPLDQVSFSCNEAHATARQVAFYIATAKKQGVPMEKLMGNSENDPLQCYYAIFYDTWPPREAVRLAIDLIEFCTEHMPRWNHMCLAAYNREETGINAVQELAFALTDAICYFEACLERGLEVDRFAPRFSFYWAVGMDFFENVAKLRAARRMWAKLVKERFGAKRPESMRMRMHIQTAGRSTIAPQAENNIIRTTLQGLSAVLGGVQSLHITTFDEPLGTPTDLAQRLSVRAHQIIAHESGATNTIDPLAGSYYVETLTNQIEEEAWKLLHRIEDLGGAIAAIESGFYLREIERNVRKEQGELASKERIVVGQNEFTDTEGEFPYNWHEPDRGGWERLLQRLRQVKEERDNRRVQEILFRITEAAAGKENLMPLLIEAVEAYATVAEINRALTQAWGKFQFNLGPQAIVTC